MYSNTDQIGVFENLTGRLPTLFIVLLVIPIVFSLFRIFAPRNRAAELMPDNGRRLPYMVPYLCMFAMAGVFGVGGFYLLRGVNQFWASFYDDAVLKVYPVREIWWFLPGFSALVLPWLLTLWLLRKLGYAAQAAEFIAEGNEKANFDCDRVMRWLAWGILLPVALFTLPAIPMHLAVTRTEVRVTGYGRLTPDVFRLVDAKKAYMVDGYYLRDGNFEPHADLLVDFADGRRLDANAVGDGGTEPSPQLVQLLLSGGHLTAVHVKTAEDIPRNQ